jgi:hypothetical protein
MDLLHNRILDIAKQEKWYIEIKVNLSMEDIKYELRSKECQKLEHWPRIIIQGRVQW